MIKFSHPVVIVFGAGASKGGLEAVSAISPPMDQNFFDVAKMVDGGGSRSYATRVLKDVYGLYRRSTSVGLEQYYQDIESRSKIIEIAKPNNQPKDWETRKDALVELIRRVIIQTTSSVVQNRRSASLSDFHKKILSQLTANDVLMTFNYDLVIEESFADANLWNPVTGYGETFFGKRNEWCRKWLKQRNIMGNAKVPKSHVSLLKLHGSINWKKLNNGRLSLNDRPYLARPDKKDKATILPPGWNKQVGKNPYRRFWEKAYKAIVGCKTLIIVGYSLPVTDFLAQALFNEAVRQKEVSSSKLKQLHVVDCNPVIQDKFIALSSSILGPGGHVFRYGGIKEFAEACEK